MRRLHVVGKHEKFVASGVYKVYAGDEPTGLIESWSIHEVGDGAQFIRVDVDGREVDGRSTLMEALRTPDGFLERVDRHDYSPHRSQPNKVSYTFFDDRVEILQTDEDHLRETLVDLPLGYHVLVGSRLLTGLAAADVAQQESAAPVFYSFLEAGELKWAIVEILPRFTGQKSVQVAGRMMAADGYGWDNEMTVWLDKYGVALLTETSTENSLLTQYARRPEPQSHA